MNYKIDLKTVIISAIVIVLVDAIYLNIIGKYYMKMINNIQGKAGNIKMTSAVACYILLVLGLNYFILNPAKESKKPLNQSILDAFILGLVIYGVYETTSHALFDKWDVKPLIYDSVWGGCLFAISTYIVLKLN